MTFLSDNEKNNISAAIDLAESNTRGEFVTVIAQAADDYLYIPTLWAALVALLVPGLINMLGWNMLAWPFVDEHAYAIQVLTFFVCALGFRWTPIKRLLIPKTVQYQRAHRLAQEQFFKQNLHSTQERTGVLLFVSITEHYVEVIADKGINDAVATDIWDHTVAEFIQHVKRGQVAAGFLQAIATCGEVLSEHFPGSGESRNELPNHLIEI